MRTESVENMSAVKCPKLAWMLTPGHFIGSAVWWLPSSPPCCRVPHWRSSYDTSRGTSPQRQTSGSIVSRSYLDGALSHSPKCYAEARIARRVLLQAFTVLTAGLVVDGAYSRLACPAKVLAEDDVTPNQPAPDKSTKENLSDRNDEDDEEREVLLAKAQALPSASLSEFYELIDRGEVSRVWFFGTKYEICLFETSAAQVNKSVRLVSEGYPVETASTPETPLSVIAHVRDSKVPFSMTPLSRRFLRRRQKAPVESIS